MIDPDYRVEALDVLLDRNRLPERYFPLIPYRDALIRGLKQAGCVTKNDAAALPDMCFSEMGLKDGAEIALLRRFFTLYDPKPSKFRELRQSPGYSERDAMLVLKDILYHEYLDGRE